MSTADLPAIRACRPAWNERRVVGQKRPLIPKHVWAILVRLHISTCRYARRVREWVRSIDLHPTSCGTHSMRWTKISQLYRKTGNLRAVQLLHGHTKMDSTIRYLGIELEDALAISESVESW